MRKRPRQACGVLPFRCHRGSGGKEPVEATNGVNLPEVSTDEELSINTSRGRNARNTFRKIKKNLHKILSPVSGDKSVHRVALPLQFLEFLYSNTSLPKR